MDTQAQLLWGLLFSSIGFGFLIYGGRQKAPVPLACGVGLMMIPYFISNALILVAAGLALMAMPYFVRL